jgi:hypothetical protein
MQQIELQARGDREKHAPNNSTGRRIQRWIGPFKNRLRELIAGVIALRKTGGQQQ